MSYGPDSELGATIVYQGRETTLTALSHKEGQEQQRMHLVDFTGLHAIASALSVNQTLREVSLKECFDLHYQPLPNAEAKRLAAAVLESKSLRVFSSLQLAELRGHEPTKANANDLVEASVQMQLNQSDGAKIETIQAAKCELNVEIHTQPSNLLMVSRSHLKLTLMIQPLKNMLKNHPLIFPLPHLLKKSAGLELLDL